MNNPNLEPYLILAQEMMRQVLSEWTPEDVHNYAANALAKLGATPGEDAVLLWPEALAAQDALIDKRLAEAALPPEQRKRFDWPWATWNARIDPLEPGLLTVIAGADGSGKTIYAEAIAEHWARKGNQVAFVHFELSRDIMHDRRLSRHSLLERRQIRYPETLSPADLAKLRSVRRTLAETFDGWLNYVHTPGWTIEAVLVELDKMRAEEHCEIAVVDYLEKAQPSERQLRMGMRDTYSREADNVEKIKTWSERTGVPVVLLSQFNKAAKGKDAEALDRTAIRGAGEKTERANIVVLIHRERVDDGYAREVDVRVDKNTLGVTGTFVQGMAPEVFTVRDIREG